jgi:uncharacterized protein YecE (DUF72 family)
MTTSRSTAGRGVVRIGTSGWQYDDWRGRFYPEDAPKRSWFSHYATHFPTVEINATFYRLPRTSTVQRWQDAAPDRFRYAIKGSRYLTHIRKLNDPADPVATITDRMASLKTFHGVWLWQLPPNLHVDVDRLATFLTVLPGGPGHAVEFRHRSWYVDAVADVLAEHGVAWVWLSDGQLPGDGSIRVPASARARRRPRPALPLGLHRRGAATVGRAAARGCRRRSRRLGVLQQRSRRQRAA